MTGWCVRKGPEERSGVVVTQVWFRQLSEANHLFRVTHADVDGYESEFHLNSS